MNIIDILNSGLYDPALGPSDFGSTCPTCNELYQDCPGHIGHVELSIPVYNPLLFRNLISILKSKCMNCHGFLMDQTRVRYYYTEISLIDCGEFCKALELKRELNKLVNPNGEPDKEKQIELIEHYERYCKTINREYKDSLLFSHSRQYRSTLINDFLQNQPKMKCENCSAPVIKYKTDGKTKIFSVRLNTKQLNQLKQSGTEYKNIIDNSNNIQGMEGIDINNLNEDDSDEDDSESSDGENSDGEIIINTDKESQKVKELKKLEYISPLEIEMQLKHLWEKENEICNLIWGSSYNDNRLKGYEIFFIKSVPVTPNRFRPPQLVNDRMCEHPQNTNLSNILTLNEKLLGLKMTSKFEFMRRNAKENNKEEGDDVENEDDEEEEEKNGETEKEKVKKRLENFNLQVNSMIQLQENVNSYIDSTLSRNPSGPGIKQLLEKKEGLFRKNMMGKRVNFACRSVISPDPNLDTDEIGLPVRFATNLCYATYVTNYNINELRKYIINGSDKYPGAMYIEDQNGKMLSLKGRSLQQRKALSRTLLINTVGNDKPKRVWRHLLDGDIVLVNRQPTLHKPSIMAMRVKVLKSKRQTIRMHYSNCNTFNADFDGDEINIHFPQNEVARSEGYNIVSAIHQYLSLKDGSPLRGLIQDSVSSALLLTKKDTFFTREMYQEMVYFSLSGLRKEFSARKIKPIYPAILKPKILYTGKQIITTILNQLTGELPGLNYEGRSKVQDKQWGKGGKYTCGDVMNMGEQEILILDNYMIKGTLDKSSIGATSYSMIHAIYEVYGPVVSAAALSSLARLFMLYYQYAGFTCGMDDLILNKEADEKRSKIIENSLEKGILGTADFVEIQNKSIPIQVLHSEVRKQLQSKMLNDGMSEVNEQWDQTMRQLVSPISSDIIKVCLPYGLIKEFPNNMFSTMVTSGAKGSVVNHSQISCCLGQQELEGRRVPIMCSGKSLPSFAPFDPNPRCGGFISDRFLTGIRPQEYYFHCMAGREGLVDTAVKTSRSGYLQRCVMKSLEDLVVKYDYSVRDGEGNIIELLYGDDCMDVGGTSYLLGKDSEFRFLIKNYQGLAEKYHISSISFGTEDGLQIEGPNEQFTVLSENKKIMNEINNDDVIPEDHIVLARRKIDEEKDYQIGNIRKGWFEGKITKTIKEGDMIYYSILFKGEKKKINHIPYRIKDKTTNALLQIVKLILPNTVQSKYPPGSYFGSIGESTYEKIRSYTDRNPDKLLENMPTFEVLMWLKTMRGLVSPGESVGTIAAQSIGEPSTQMTLNTFHLAGHGAVNVTMGIPRLREIIMTASKTILTPLMELPLKENVTMKEAKKLANSLYRLKFSDLLDPKKSIDVKSVIMPKTSAKISYIRRYVISIKFVDLDIIKDEYSINEEMLTNIIANTYCPALLMHITKLIKKLHKDGNHGSTIQTVNVEKKSKKNKSNENGNDEEDDNDDEAKIDFNKIYYEDGDEEKKAKSKKEIVSYEDDEEEENQEDEFNRKLAEITEEDGDEEDSNNIKDYNSSGDDEENEEESEKQKKNKAAKREEEEEERNKPILYQYTDDSPIKPYINKGYKEVPCDVIVSKSSFFNGLVFNPEDKKAVIILNIDPNVQKLLMVDICEDVAMKTIISSVTGIKRCVVLPQEGNSTNIKLQTDGVNFQAIWKLKKLIDINHVVCNDIALILDLFGVEAARSAIMNEINRVFSVYGISVDKRHLGLVADYMTYQGCYTPMSRMGLADHGSPYLQMSYETTSQFLTKAALYGSTDNMNTPSARISVGELMRAGTGSFDIYEQLFPDK